MVSKYKNKWIDGKLYYSHRLVWEAANGPIPEGMDIHHIDGNSKNNHILNLACVTTSDHLRMHSGNYCLVDGTWRIICKYCRCAKPIDSFPTSVTRKGVKTLKSFCKPCRNNRDVMRRSSDYKMILGSDH
jgi:hypothetical protein